MQRSRQYPDLALGASPRSGAWWLQTSKAAAWLAGRDYVTPDDVKAVALPLLRHRLILKPEAMLDGLTYRCGDCLVTESSPSAKMIPSRRVYLLLLLGIALAPLLAVVWSVPVSILDTLLFDGIVLGLMVLDGFRRVRLHRVQIARALPPRLSIGRDNPVVLSIKSGNANAQLQIRDYYPAGFGVSKPVSTSLPAQSSQELPIPSTGLNGVSFSGGIFRCGNWEHGDWLGMTGKFPKVRRLRFIQI